LDGGPAGFGPWVSEGSVLFPHGLRLGRDFAWTIQTELNLGLMLSLLLQTRTHPHLKKQKDGTGQRLPCRLELIRDPSSLVSCNHATPNPILQNKHAPLA
jgi:hypothetical protein